MNIQDQKTIIVADGYMIAYKVTWDVEHPEGVINTRGNNYVFNQDYFSPCFSEDDLQDTQCIFSSAEEAWKTFEGELANAPDYFTWAGPSESDNWFYYAIRPVPDMSSSTNRTYTIHYVAPMEWQDDIEEAPDMDLGAVREKVHARIINLKEVGGVDDAVDALREVGQDVFPASV